MTDFSFDKNAGKRLALTMESHLDGIEHYAAEKIATLPTEDVSARLKQLGLDEARAIDGVKKYLALRGERQHSNIESSTSTLHDLLFGHAGSSEHDDEGCEGKDSAGPEDLPILTEDEKIGHLIVAWLEDGGERFLKGSQPDAYQALMLHVGGTDVLKRYSRTEDYWQPVQLILDALFAADERADMCKKLLKVYPLDRSTLPAQFFSEIAAQELIDKMRNDGEIIQR